MIPFLNSGNLYFLLLLVNCMCLFGLYLLTSYCWLYIKTIDFCILVLVFFIISKIISYFYYFVIIFCKFSFGKNHPWVTIFSYLYQYYYYDSSLVDFLNCVLFYYYSFFNLALASIWWYLFKKFIYFNKINEKLILLFSTKFVRIFTYLFINSFNEICKYLVNTCYAWSILFSW